MAHPLESVQVVGKTSDFLQSASATQKRRRVDLCAAIYLHSSLRRTQIASADAKAGEKWARSRQHFFSAYSFYVMCDCVCVSGALRPFSLSAPALTLMQSRRIDICPHALLVGEPFLRRDAFRGAYCALCSRVCSCIITAAACIQTDEKQTTRSATAFCVSASFEFVWVVCFVAMAFCSCHNL